MPGLSRDIWGATLSLAMKLCYTKNFANCFNAWRPNAFETNKVAYLAWVRGKM